MHKLKILVVPSDRTGVSYFRSTNPHLVLEKLYPDEFHVDIDYEPQLNNDEWLKQYDIIHYHRTLGQYEQMETLINKLKGLGIVTIMDLDDYWAPGEHHPSFKLIKAAQLDVKIANNVKIAENVTTTTSLFAKEISRLNKNVFVLPNSIDINDKQFVPKTKEKSDRLRVGWLGGSSHLEDLNLLNGVVNKLTTDGLINKIQFVLCGFDIRGVRTEVDPVTNQPIGQRDLTPKETAWYEYEKIFTDNYTSVSPEYKNFLLRFTKDEFPNVANEPYRRVWTKHISDYATNYNLFDVSLAPLKENMFNKVKSQLKVIEAGFHNKAIIAQNFGPYQIDLTNALEFGGGLNLIANSILVDTHKNHKDWYGAIKKLVNNPELVKTLQTNLSETIQNRYSAEKVAESRRELYLKLANKNKPVMVV